MMRAWKFKSRDEALAVLIRWGFRLSTEIRGRRVRVIDPDGVGGYLYIAPRARGVWAEVGA